MTSSIAVVGPSGSGKESFIRSLSSMLYMPGLITGMSVRGASMMAHSEGLFDEGNDGSLQIRPHADTRIRQWLGDKRNGLHFVTMPRGQDTITHIFFGKRDLTDVIRPTSNGSKDHRRIEWGAATIAANPQVREAFFPFWRQAILSIAPVIVGGKTPEKFMPEAGVIFSLKTDESTAAGYRLVQGVAVYDSFAEEREYLKRRNALHEQSGLEYISDRTKEFDTTNYVLVPDGIRSVAEQAAKYTFHLHQQAEEV